MKKKKKKKIIILIFFLAAMGHHTNAFVKNRFKVYLKCTLLLFFYGPKVYLKYATHFLNYFHKLSNFGS